MDYLWSPWRYQYVSKSGPPAGCLFCIKGSEQRDKENYVVHRGPRTFVILNLYPYSTGHLMIAPYEHVASLEPAPEATLEEMMRMLAESGHLGGEVPALAIPTNLSALIGARLDALPAGERRTAQHSSVVGGVFWSSAVAKLEQGDADVSGNLAALGRRDLIQERETSSVAGEREWAFKHILIRDVAYTRVPKARRAALHTRCADWIGVRMWDSRG